MRNLLEGELISIAHRILKLKGKSEVIQLQQEVLQLYEKLSVLRFVEENLDNISLEIPDNIEEKLKNTSLYEQKNTTESQVSTENITEKTQKEIFSETKEDSLKESSKDYEKIVFEELSDAESKDSILVSPETIYEIEQTPSEQASKTEKNYSEQPIKEKEEKKPKPEEITLSFEDFEEQLSTAKPQKTPTIFKEEPTGVISEIKPTQDEQVSELRNKEREKKFDIRLNDRVAFEFHLFDGDVEGFDQVILRLSTFDTFDTAKDFVENQVKPDYNNWIGKEEYENRFMGIIRNGFL